MKRMMLAVLVALFGANLAHAQDDRSFPWIQGEWLRWQVKNGTLPAPILTTTTDGSATGLGRLNSANTVALYGSDIDYGYTTGVRISGGMSFGPWGIEGNWFDTGRPTNIYEIRSGNTGHPFLARPFFNSFTNAEDSTDFVSPGVGVGGAAIKSTTNFWGAEGSARLSLIGTEYFGFEILAGYRYAHLVEDLGYGFDATALPGSTLSFGGAVVPAGETIRTYDYFSANNDFNGGQIGFRARGSYGLFFADIIGKLAIGNNHQVVDIFGFTTRTNGGVVTANARGGHYALPSNMGQYENNQFSLLPEVGVNVGLNLGDHIQLFGGYTLVYWTDVVRAGDQLNRIIDPRQMPSSTSFNGAAVVAQPQPVFRTTDYWAQGLNIGLAIRW